MSRPWFTTHECTALEIRKYQSISVPRVTSTITINDTIVIQSIMARVESIPPAGDRMISFAPDAECIELLFHAADETTRKIEIHQRRFKTPSTGFNSGTREGEAALYDDIDAWLFPALDKVILKARDVELQFKDFSLTCLGETHPDKSPASVSLTANRFLLKDMTGHSQIVRIISGQLPPPAHDFEIDGKTFTVLTRETETGRRLYPDHFQVIGHQH